ncbi:DUF6443 domain-containing protein, partial [Chryseobacterium proteolyticum]|uniref:DUF6443 domain-containing protein n=1 Tax=Chryseobacterium proteolyticum TaxID=118127 RepID=UPI0039832ED2
MKKIKQTIYISSLIISGLLHAQLSPTENYVYSKTILDYNTSNVATKTSETVQYFDGLGRPKQVINIKASPTGKDVVTPIEYDGFGRQVKDYLPIPQGQTLNGGIVSNPLANVINTPYGQEKIYAEKTLENSPLDRLLEQKQVGTAWSDKPLKFEYNTNTATDVRKYTTTTSFANNTTNSIPRVSPNDTNTANGYYKANQLYKNSVKDEDGNETLEFKNGQGQTVLVRKIISATDNADTYYVFNEYDQLAFIIPPNAAYIIKTLAVGGQIPGTVLNDLCYQYRYDGKNRLVEKKLPGKGWEFMVYNKADQLVMSRDPNLITKEQWLFTKYDQFGRVVYTGLINNKGSRLTLQAAVDGNANLYETRSTTAFTLNSMPVYYSNIASPLSNIDKILTVNYYDTYPPNTPAITNSFSLDLLTDTVSSDRSTRGLSTASYVKNIEDDNWTKSFIWYDIKGRPVITRNNNHLGGYTVINHKLDFSGAILQTNTYHKRLATDIQKNIEEKFTYDSQNRLLIHTHKIDNGTVEYLSQNKYNELSQLEWKKVGGVGTTTPLQQVDYKYNIRGWMTKINDPSNLNGKLFGYEVRYNNPVNTLFAISRYNGNIAEVDWKTSVDSVLRRYSYSYDTLN